MKFKDKRMKICENPSYQIKKTKDGLGRCKDNAWIYIPAVTIIIIYLLFPSDIKTFKVKEKKTNTGRHRIWYLVLP